VEAPTPATLATSLRQYTEVVKLPIQSNP
jgi:hypothetical protein